MKAYVKKNLVVKSGGIWGITALMRDLEGTIIDVVWDARGAWRGEVSPYWLWEDEWLMILPDGYDLAKAVGVNIEWYDSYVKQAIEINKLKEEIAALKKTLLDKDNIIAGSNINIDSLKRRILSLDCAMEKIHNTIDSLYIKN